MAWLMSVSTGTTARRGAITQAFSGCVSRRMELRS